MKINILKKSWNTDSSTMSSLKEPVKSFLSLQADFLDTKNPFLTTYSFLSRGLKCQTYFRERFYKFFSVNLEFPAM